MLPGMRHASTRRTQQLRALDGETERELLFVGGPTGVPYVERKEALWATPRYIYTCQPSSKGNFDDRLKTHDAASFPAEFSTMTVEIG